MRKSTHANYSAEPHNVQQLIYETPLCNAALLSETIKSNATKSDAVSQHSQRSWCDGYRMKKGTKTYSG